MTAFFESLAATTRTSAALRAHEGLGWPSIPGNPGTLIVNREQINLFWLIRLRWAAIVGQLLTVAVTYLVLAIDVPIGYLLTIIGIEAVSNLAFTAGYRYAMRQAPQLIQGHSGERILGMVMILDVCFLSALLFVSGGPANPFSAFYIVNLSLAAAVLPARWAWGLAIVAVTLYSLLFLGYLPVAALDHHGSHAAMAHHGEAGHHEHHAAHVGDADESMNLHLHGMLVAFAGTAMFVAYFVTRIRKELSLRDQQLAESERRKSQAEKLESLATLAAGAAHELATPLATIAVVAHELELRLIAGHQDSSPDLVEDVSVIRAEIERCRNILGAMATQAGESMGESWRIATVGELLDASAAATTTPARVEIDCAAPVAELRLRIPHRALVQSLRSLLKNAIEASSPDQTVQINARRAERGLRITVSDRGNGIPAESLPRVGEPFFTTKPPGQGLGLGLFLARRVVEQLGGQLLVEANSAHGTRAVIDLPTACLA